MSQTTSPPFIPANGQRIPAQFVGVPPATLLLWLQAAQQALHDLTIGGKPSVILYNSGEGSRQVTYTRATVGQLGEYVAALAAALHLAPPRRAIAVRF